MAVRCTLGLRRRREYGSSAARSERVVSGRELAATGDAVLRARLKAVTPSCAPTTYEGQDSVVRNPKPRVGR